MNETKLLNIKLESEKSDRIIIKQNITISLEKIKEFCHRWQITEFSLFGSVLRDDFRPDSDIDVLVTFMPSAPWTILDIIRMETELVSIFERPVDLVCKDAIAQSLNYLRRQNILNSYEVIYART
jgi:hypothetical protein